jgi:hypothetical protein
LELPPKVVPSSNGSTQSPQSSRFTYTEDLPAITTASTTSTANGHISAPSMATDFFSEFGGISSLKKQPMNGRPKVQVRLNPLPVIMDCVLPTQIHFNWFSLPYLAIVYMP